MRNNDMQNRRTREQMKRVRIKKALTAAIMVVVWIFLTVWALGIWAEHPGEQPISGREYVASLQQ